MKLNLTDLWTSWRGREAPKHLGKDYVSMKALARQLVPEIQKEGFLVGSQRKIEDLLSTGMLEPLPSIDTQFHKIVKVCGFVFFLNLLWP